MKLVKSDMETYRMMQEGRSGRQRGLALEIPPGTSFASVDGKGGSWSRFADDMIHAIRRDTDSEEIFYCVEEGGGGSGSTILRVWAAEVAEPTAVAVRAQLGEVVAALVHRSRNGNGQEGS